MASKRTTAIMQGGGVAGAFILDPNQENMHSQPNQPLNNKNNISHFSTATPSLSSALPNTSSSLSDVTTNSTTSSQTSSSSTLLSLHPRLASSSSPSLPGSDLLTSTTNNNSNNSLLLSDSSVVSNAIPLSSSSLSSLALLNEQQQQLLLSKQSLVSHSPIPILSNGSNNPSLISLGGVAGGVGLSSGSSSSSSSSNSSNNLVLPTQQGLNQHFFSSSSKFSQPITSWHSNTDSRLVNRHPSRLHDGIRPNTSAISTIQSHFEQQQPQQQNHSIPTMLNDNDMNQPQQYQQSLQHSNFGMVTTDLDQSFFTPIALHQPQLPPQQSNQRQFVSKGNINGAIPLPVHGGMNQHIYQLQQQQQQHPHNVSIQSLINNNNNNNTYDPRPRHLLEHLYHEAKVLNHHEKCARLAQQQQSYIIQQLSRYFYDYKQLESQRDMVVSILVQLNQQFEQQEQQQQQQQQQQLIDSATSPQLSSSSSTTTPSTAPQPHSQLYGSGNLIGKIPTANDGVILPQLTISTQIAGSTKKKNNTYTNRENQTTETTILSSPQSQSLTSSIQQESLLHDDPLNTSIISISTSTMNDHNNHHYNPLQEQIQYYQHQLFSLEEALLMIQSHLKELSQEKQVQTNIIKFHEEKSYSLSKQMHQEELALDSLQYNGNSNIGVQYPTIQHHTNSIHPPQLYESSFLSHQLIQDSPPFIPNHYNVDNTTTPSYLSPIKKQYYPQRKSIPPQTSVDLTDSPIHTSSQLYEQILSDHDDDIVDNQSTPTIELIDDSLPLLPPPQQHVLHSSTSSSPIELDLDIDGDAEEEEEQIIPVVEVDQSNNNSMVDNDDNNEPVPSTIDKNSSVDKGIEDKPSKRTIKTRGQNAKMTNDSKSTPLMQPSSPPLSASTSLSSPIKSKASPVKSKASTTATATPTNTTMSDQLDNTPTEIETKPTRQQRSSLRTANTSSTSNRSTRERKPNGGTTVSTASVDTTDTTASSTVPRERNRSYQTSQRQSATQGTDNNIDDHIETEPPSTRSTRSRTKLSPLKPTTPTRSSSRKPTPVIPTTSTTTTTSTTSTTPSKSTTSLQQEQDEQQQDANLFDPSDAEDDSNVNTKPMVKSTRSSRSKPAATTTSTTSTSLKSTPTATKGRGKSPARKNTIVDEVKVDTTSSKKSTVKGKGDTTATTTKPSITTTTTTSTTATTNSIIPTQIKTTPPKSVSISPIVDVVSIIDDDLLLDEDIIEASDVSSTNTTTQLKSIFSQAITVPPPKLPVKNSKYLHLPLTAFQDQILPSASFEQTKYQSMLNNARGVRSSYFCLLCSTYVTTMKNHAMAHFNFFQSPIFDPQSECLHCMMCFSNDGMKMHLKSTHCPGHSASSTSSANQTKSTSPTVSTNSNTTLLSGDGESQSIRNNNNYNQPPQRPPQPQQQHSHTPNRFVPPKVPFPPIQRLQQQYHPQQPHQHYHQQQLQQQQHQQHQQAQRQQQQQQQQQPQPQQQQSQPQSRSIASDLSTSNLAQSSTQHKDVKITPQASTITMTDDTNASQSSQDASIDVATTTISTQIITNPKLVNSVSVSNIHHGTTSQTVIVGAYDNSVSTTIPALPNLIEIKNNRTTSSSSPNSPHNNSSFPSSSSSSPASSPPSSSISPPLPTNVVSSSNHAKRDPLQLGAVSTTSLPLQSQVNKQLSIDEQQQRGLLNQLSTSSTLSQSQQQQQKDDTLQQPSTKGSFAASVLALQPSIIDSTNFITPPRLQSPQQSINSTSPRTAIVKPTVSSSSKRAARKSSPQNFDSDDDPFAY